MLCSGTDELDCTVYGMTWDVDAAQVLYSASAGYRQVFTVFYITADAEYSVAWQYQASFNLYARE